MSTYTADAREKLVHKATRKMAKRAAKMAREQVERDHAARRPQPQPRVAKVAADRDLVKPAAPPMSAVLDALERLNPPHSTRIRIERARKALTDPSNNNLRR